MPLIASIPSHNSPAPVQTSPLQRVGSALESVAKDFAFSYATPYVKAYDYWLKQPKALSFELSDPYRGWKSASDLVKMTVSGDPIPVGAVMTHCQVRSPLEYRATALAEAVSTVSRATIAPNAQGISTVKIVSRSTETQALRDEINKQAGEIAKQITAKAIADAKKAGTSKTSAKGVAGIGVSDVILKVNDDPRIKALLAQLDKAINDEKFGKPSSRLRKVHVGDLQPRVAELRFTLMDVISAGELQASRHEVLASLIKMFCANNKVSDSGQAPVGSLLTEAAKVTAEAVAGRLVRVSSAGIDPYGVDIWATSSFLHQEVPDTDLIFVRITLVEYESLFMSNARPKPVGATAPATSPALPGGSIAPAAPARPSYIPADYRGIPGAV